MKNTDIFFYYFRIINIDQFFSFANLFSSSVHQEEIIQSWRSNGIQRDMTRKLSSSGSPWLSLHHTLQRYKNNNPEWTQQCTHFKTGEIHIPLLVACHQIINKSTNRDKLNPSNNGETFRNSYNNDTLNETE